MNKIFLKTLLIASLILPVSGCFMKNEPIRPQFAYYIENLNQEKYSTSGFSLNVAINDAWQDYDQSVVTREADNRLTISQRAKFYAPLRLVLQNWINDSVTFNNLPSFKNRLGIRLDSCFCDYSLQKPTAIVNMTNIKGEKITAEAIIEDNTDAGKINALNKALSSALQTCLSNLGEKQ